MSSVKQGKFVGIDERLQLKNMKFSSEVNAPKLWVERLEVHKRFPNGRETELRGIDLHKGLNILWAKSDEDGKRIGGHGAGKTTFCRLIRYALGDSNAGSKAFREKFCNEYPDGRLLAVVHVDSVPWLVCRPFAPGTGRESFAIRHVSITSSVKAPSVSDSFNRYLEEIHRTVFQGHSLTLASSKRKVDWTMFLQWLTRDQEAHYASLTSWRQKDSESNPVVTLSANDRNNLLRLVMQMISESDQKSIAKRDELSKEHEKSKADDKQASHHFQQLKRALAQKMQVQGVNISGESLSKTVENWIEQVSKDIDSNINMLDSDEELKRRQEVCFERKFRYQFALDNLNELQEAARKGGESSATLDEKAVSLKSRVILRGLLPFSGFCSTPLATAKEKQCPCLTERPEDINFQEMLSDLDEQKKKEIAQLDGLARDIRIAEAKTEVCKEAFTQSGKAVEDRKLHLKSQRKELRIRSEELGSYREALDAFNAANSSVVSLKEAAKSAQKKISAIDEKLKVYTMSRAKRLSSFSDIFDACIRNMLGDDEEVRGKIRLAGGKAFDPEIEYHGDFDSAALSLAKLLSFDLAAMVLKLKTDQGLHPCFLMHDSPREADLDAGIYQGLFEVAVEMERACGESPMFQYIITTTEPPPEELQKSKWLLEPVLNASVAEERFLGVDL